MSGENGTKNRIIWSLLALLQGIILGWVYKVNNIQEVTTIKVATLEAHFTDIEKDLDDIKQILLDHRRQP